MRTEKKLELIKEIATARVELANLNGVADGEATRLLNDERAAYWYAKDNSGESLERELAQTKREIEGIHKKARWQQYMETEEGKAKLAAFEARAKEVLDKENALVADYEDKINTMLHSVMDSRMKIAIKGDSSAEIGLYTGKTYSNGKERSSFRFDVLFGDSFYYGTDSKSRFEINYGTCGGFDPFAESGDDADYTAFTASLGKFLGDRELLSKVRDILNNDFLKEQKALHKEGYAIVDEKEQWKENYLSAKA